jgi:uncharacterized membrane protein
MYEALLILHFLGLAMGLGISFLMAGIGMRTARLEEAVADQIMSVTGAVAGVLGAVSLLLLWGSGLALVLTYDGLFESGGLSFHIKLILVILLTVFIGLIHMETGRIRRGQNAKAAAARIENYSKIVLLLGVAVVVLAVLAFG